MKRDLYKFVEKRKHIVFSRHRKSKKPQPGIYSKRICKKVELSPREERLCDQNLLSYRGRIIKKNDSMPFPPGKVSQQ